MPALTVGSSERGVPLFFSADFMPISVHLDEKVVVMLDAKQRMEAREAGRADILRLMEFDPQRQLYWISELKLSAAGFHIRQRKVN